MSNVYGITVDNMLSTLPDVLRNDETMLALASVTAELFAVLPKEIDAIHIYSHVDELPELLLDILAYDFKVDWWDPDYPLDTKRQLLKDSWRIKRMLGTKAAVEQATSAVYKNTIVSEWFEYGGPPYEFKLLIDATYENADPKKHRRVLDRIDYYKNLRSTPYSVEYVAYPQGSCMSYFGVAALGVEIDITVEVKDYGVG